MSQKSSLLQSAKSVSQVLTSSTPLNGQPEKEGFGSVLARLTVTGQLAGKISRDWNPEGLTVNLSASLDRLME